MSATKPEKNPPQADLQRELAAAAAVVADPPPANYQGIQRGATKPLAWKTNWAWWQAYELPPGTKIAAGDDAAAAAWLRINQEVARLDFKQGLGVPANGWDSNQPTWPLPTPPKSWPAGSRFAARRPWSKKVPQTRYHTGTDLAAEAGTPVLAPEAGTIVAPDSGWDYDKATGEGVKAVIMVTDSGRTILLGGIVPGSATVTAGQRVSAGEPIAVVGRYPGVKGKPGPAMLHFQLYGRKLTEAEVNKRKKWDLDAPAPADILDAESYLKGASANPRYGSVGLLGEGDGPGLVIDDIEGGELAEGLEDALAAAKELADKLNPPSPMPWILGGLAAAGLVAGLIIVTLPTRPTRPRRRAAA